MKTVFICFFPAWPPTSGAAAVSYACAKHWPGERTLLQLADPSGRQVTKDNVDVVSMHGSHSRLGKLIAVARCAHTIVTHCRAAQPDLIVLEGASWVGYHWYLLRLLRLAKLRARIFYHAHNVEYILRKSQHGRIVQLLTRLCERSVVRHVDVATAVSEVDQRQFASLYGAMPLLLPNGVDLDSCSPTQSMTTITEEIKRKYGLGGGPLILFMGLYQYRPNTEAVDFLVKEVMPCLVQCHPNASLAIIGGETPYREPWLINPGCIPAEEVAPFIRACTVGVAPIFSGSGTRLKILEYMAAGLPVVATEKGAEGLGLLPDVHYLRAELSTDFVRQLGEVLLDGSSATELALRTQRIVKERFAWDRIVAAFLDKADPPEGYQTQTTATG